MLTIRLQRVGRRNQAAFRIVLAEKQRAVKKKAVEILGHYDPRSKEFGLKDEERVKYWIGQNVEVSPTVHNLFVEKGLVQDKKKSAWRPKVKGKSDEAQESEGGKSEETETADAPASEKASSDEADKNEDEKSEQKTGESETSAVKAEESKEEQQDKAEQKSNDKPTEAKAEAKAGKEEKQSLKSDQKE